MNYDWADLAFGSKKPLNDLNATFIAAPRDLSPSRFKQLVKTYLPQGNIILGLSQEDYVLGLENQPQFQMLKAQTLKSLIDQVNAQSPHKIITLIYAQRDLKHVLAKLKLRQVLLINGSWYQMFHLKPEYYVLVNSHTPYKLVSPFADEAEAKAYAKTHQPPDPKLPKTATAEQMFALAAAAAAQSFSSADYQTGVALGRKSGTKYQPLATAYNRVVPYQTYAWHHGSVREQNFSPPHDLNFYDTNHAEIELITKAVRDSIDLTATTLFINLLPCPTCARMFSATGITEFVYRHDHSEGYAIKLLESAGKTVRRLVLP